MSVPLTAPVLLSLSLHLMLPGAYAQEFIEEYKAESAANQSLTPRFGTSIALEGDVLVVGEPWRTPEGFANVFRRTGGAWTYTGGVVSPATAGDFGHSLDLDGTTLVVGGPTGASGGRAYVYEILPGGITQPTAELRDDNVTAFGSGVAVSGDTILVSDLGTGVQGIFVFRRNGAVWDFDEQFFPSGVVASPNEFGFALDLDGDTAIVGAPDEDGQKGAAYVFQFDGLSWVQQARIQRNNPLAGDRFGHSVAVWGNRVLVGAPGDDTNLGPSGTAHLFIEAGGVWTLEEKLVLPQGKSFSGFGHSVDLEDTTAIVGFTDEDNGFQSNRPGGALVFDNPGTGWTLRTRLPLSESEGGQRAGFSVALDGSQVAVGADRGNVAFVLVEEPGYPAPVAYCTAGTSSNSCQAGLTAYGVASATQPLGGSLWAWGAEEDRNGLFYFGANGRQAAPWGNGSSFQCVVPPVWRSPKVDTQRTFASSPTTCSGGALFDLNAHWTLRPQQNPGAGALVQAQFWYRDPMNTSSMQTSLSDAAEFLVGP